MTTKTKVNLTFGLFVIAFVGGLVLRFMSTPSVDITAGPQVQAPEAGGAAPEAANSNRVDGMPTDREVNAQNPQTGPAFQGGNSAAEEEELSEEDKLAKTDPVWRKAWERYKKMFILAQQMRQQPPAKPMMPHLRNRNPNPPPPIAEDESDYDPNPFRFPEE